MVLDRAYEGNLSDLSGDDDSLHAQNCDSYDTFRKYWRSRTHREFRPMERVGFYWLERWSDHDAAYLGEILLKRLYGDYLPV